MFSVKGYTKTPPYDVLANIFGLSYKHLLFITRIQFFWFNAFCLTPRGVSKPLDKNMSSSVSTDEDDREPQGDAAEQGNEPANDDGENNNEGINDENNDRKRRSSGNKSHGGAFEVATEYEELAQRYVLDIKEAIEKDLECYKNHASNKKQSFERIKILSHLNEHSKSTEFCRALISCNFLSVAEKLLEPFEGSTYNLNVVDLTIEILNNCEFQEIFMKGIFHKIRNLASNLDDSSFKRKAENLKDKWIGSHQDSRSKDP